MDYYSPAHWNNVYARPARPVAGKARHWLRETVMAEVGRAIPAGGTLLDVACGDGFLATGVPGRIHAVGADFSASAIALAHSAAPSRTWLQADATSLPLADRTVDVAVCVCGLWAIADPPASVAELARVLRPGGTAVLHLWSRAQDCRLITLGAAALAKTTSAMLLPASAIGPFDLSRDLVEDWAVTAGLNSIRWTRQEIDIVVTNVEQYWAELSGVASTAYTHYQALLPQQRQNVDETAWNGVLAIQSPMSHIVTVPLASQLMIARRV
ncbi:MAG TPA: class I SAM-dependent methyltransferase [Streptosporangiaceae bacterium]|nr:class I SAM-dependent methyltransferase [Streptosporangiaceae bacterium]